MTTAIQWTSETWNPTTGCSKVSAGCKHCYAERIWKKVYGFRPFTDVQCHPERLSQPSKWKAPRRIFVDSMSDLFHEKVPTDFIIDVFDAMEGCQRHTFQILTKRPERMKAFMDGLGSVLGNERVYFTFESAHAGYIPNNVWLGVSVEDQKSAEERIPVLLSTRAAIRFLSVEPQIAPIDLLAIAPDLHDIHTGNTIDWVIVGGESGPGARPFDLRWAYDIVTQCKQADVPVFIKQLGRKPFFSGGSELAAQTKLTYKSLGSHGSFIEAWPEDLRIREFPA